MVDKARFRKRSSIDALAHIPFENSQAVFLS
jgi:hypothetical protein